METPWVELTLVIVAILANGFFAGAEIALVSARIGRLVQLRTERVAGASAAIKLKESPEISLATIQIAITLVGALASVVGGAAAAEQLGPWFAALPVPGAPVWGEPVALGLVIVGITYFSLILGELTPKAVALRHPERLACAAAPLIAAISRAASGLVTFLTLSTNAVLRLFGQGTAQGSPFISEEDVKYLLREGAAKGVFEKVEEELVHNVFEFADTTVREIMVPRVNVLGLDADTALDEVLRRAAEIGRSRIPIYRGTLERPVGIVTIKDLFRTVAFGRPVSLAELARPPLFVPESARISALLREFQRARQNIALVVDEYGGLVGLVTIEDVLEEIVGEIREQDEAAPSYISRLPDGSYLVDGAAPLSAVRDALKSDLPDSPDYTTLAGFVLHALQTVPTRGASVTGGSYRWTVVEMTGPRIRKVQAERWPLSQ
jgi:putative hemolysin